MHDGWTDRIISIYIEEETQEHEERKQMRKKWEVREEMRKKMENETEAGRQWRGERQEGKRVGGKGASGGWVREIQGKADGGKDRQEKQMTRSRG